MLIIANGAIKSGSTWLYNILEQIVPCSNSIPIEYQNEGPWKEPSIHPHKLDKLLYELDYHNTNYVVKNHYGTINLRDKILCHSDVYVFDIRRDYRDVLVSYYYHIILRDKYDQVFKIYYWTIGRKLINEVQSYHRLWDINSPQVYCSSYEKLHMGFESEILNIAEIIGIQLSKQQIIDIKDATTINKLRRKYNEEDEEQKFFRKGIISDWKNHMSRSMIKDSEKVAKYGITKLPLYYNIIANINTYTIIHIRHMSS